ncbi:PREDICTED: uncharacterized protein LOC108761378 [Trachymyrmex cornetzi]|uniref:Uncharacterized protein n=1 Tax=Trachymyrmex cornetzi TaxID=471704 RepID=A0A195E420_9HYME|nr:PREDICTED: uncharacterized protein LOC108761378 [Trachymyrmex cornetzi]KYN19609.1 hypothetical protein ALC57_08085 [Trachymyrmex cornetzi]
MQAAGTLRGTRAISLLILLVPLISYAYSSPIQYLPSIPGYIPVYIRYGDEPLEGINPELAEAFGETSNSIKSLQKIDHTLAHDNFKDDGIDILLEESKKEHDYPLHVRAAESRSFATANDNQSGDSNKPKLLTIYTLPDDNESRPRRRYRGRSRQKSSRKRPEFKVNPLSDEETEELKKLAIEVEKEETKPNELYAPSPRHSGSSKNTHNQHRTYNFIAPMKVQVPFDETLADVPKISQNGDFSQLGYDIVTPAAEEEELPIKGQGPATIWSNVNKLLPIDLPNENEANKDFTSKIEKIQEKPLDVKIDLLEVPQDTDCSKSLNEYNVATIDKKEPPFKILNPTKILSNVDKISPINFPNQNEMKDFTQPTDENAMD